MRGHSTINVPYFGSSKRVLLGNCYYQYQVRANQRFEERFGLKYNRKNTGEHRPPPRPHKDSTVSVDHMYVVGLQHYVVDTLV